MSAVTHLIISSFQRDMEKNEPFEPTGPYCRASEGFSWPVITRAIQDFFLHVSGSLQIDHMESQQTAVTEGPSLSKMICWRVRQALPVICDSSFICKVLLDCFP